MSVVPAALVAFRCRNCGRLHEAEHAGELPHPTACRVCGKGVVFVHEELSDQLLQALQDGKIEEAQRLAREIRACNPASKRLVPENWEVLAEAHSDRLAELGLTHEQVERHIPWEKGGNPEAPKFVLAEAHDGPQTSDQAGQK